MSDGPWWASPLVITITILIFVANQHVHRWQDRLDARVGGRGDRRTKEGLRKRHPDLGQLSDEDLELVREAFTDELDRSEKRSRIFNVLVAISGLAVGFLLERVLI